MAFAIFTRLILSRLNKHSEYILDLLTLKSHWSFCTELVFFAQSRKKVDLCDFFLKGL